MEKTKKLLKEYPTMRWFVLLLVSGLMFGTYWFQDGLGPLRQMFETQLGFTTEQFGRLISSTTWANWALMIILGGMALDKWGIRKTGLVFGSIATIGAVIVALGSRGILGDNKLLVMMGGRILFGVGLETTCVLIQRIVVKWFKGYELALAMGVNVVIGRLGTFGAVSFGVDISGGELSVALITAASLIGLGFLMFIAYLIFDVKLDKQANEILDKEKEDFHFKDVIELITNHSFIYIALLCVAFYSAVFPFVQYAPDLLINKFGFTSAMPDLSGMSLWEKIGAIFHNGPKVTGLLPFATIIFTPIFGRFIDKKGKAASLMIFGAVLLIYAHLTLSVFNSVILGYSGIFALGIAFSLVPAAMWPAVAKIVAEKRLGTAYATMFTIQNYGLGLFYWGIGTVLDLCNPSVVEKVQSIREQLLAQGLTRVEITERINQLREIGEISPYDYTIPILMLVGLGIISVYLAFLLKKSDKRQGYGIELPTNQ